ncbi:hypothetical protein HD806DRAFT_288477 [Xylariaceae sp. AK1471]|nr:hypothetical protein HD806DRAFT_288477 [Xylariaceae sp. AK1471]
MAPTPPNSPKATKKHYLPNKRARVAALFSAGLTAKAIAVREGVPRLSVYKIKDRYRVQKSGQSRPGRGRHAKLTARDKRHILRLIEQNHFIFSTELAYSIGLRVSSRTIVNWLKDEGI